MSRFSILILNSSRVFSPYLFLPANGNVIPHLQTLFCLFLHSSHTEHHTGRYKRGFHSSQEPYYGIRLLHFLSSKHRSRNRSNRKPRSCLLGLSFQLSLYLIVLQSYLQLFHIGFCQYFLSRQFLTILVIDLYS